MTITFEIEAAAKDIANAASVLNNIFNGRRAARQKDKDDKRCATSFEDEVFEGLSLAVEIVSRVSKEVSHAS